MAVGAVQRRQEREPKVSEVFGAQTHLALDLLEIMEMAWHDVYGKVTFPDSVLHDMLVVSQGTLDGLIAATRQALTDWRDLRIGADAIRASHDRN